MQAALAVWATQQITQAVDTETIFTELLPSKAQPLAAPLSTAVDSFISQAALKFFPSDAFVKIWTVANRNAHADIIKVLQGKGAVSIKDGKVQLDLLPGRRRGAARRSTTAPTDGSRARSTSVTDLTPDQARAKLSQALGRPLPADFGTITVFEKQQLSTVQKAVQLFNQLGIRVGDRSRSLLIAAAFAVAPDRRRIAIWVGLSAAGFLVAFRAVGANIGPSGREADRRCPSTVTQPRRSSAACWRATSTSRSIALLIGLVVALIAFLAGPGRYAVAIRSWFDDQRVVLREHAGCDTARAVGARRSRWLLLATLTFGKLFLAALIVGALEFALWRLREKTAGSSRRSEHREQRACGWCLARVRYPLRLR